MMLSFLE